MGLFRLDKYDKYFVCLLLIFMVIFNINSVFAIEINQIVGVSAFGTIHDVAEASIIYYYPVKQNEQFSVETTEEFNQNFASVLFSTNLDSGTVTTNYGDLLNGKVELVIPEDGYLIVSTSAYATSNMFKFSNLSESLDGAVNGLVNNVGFNQIWGVFDNGINFIGVVVLVGFGLFLVALLIKKVSKGKSDF